MARIVYAVINAYPETLWIIFINFSCGKTSRKYQGILGNFFTGSSNGFPLVVINRFKDNILNKSVTYSGPVADLTSIIWTEYVSMASDNKFLKK